MKYAQLGLGADRVLLMNRAGGHKTTYSPFFAVLPLSAVM